MKYNTKWMVVSLALFIAFLVFGYSIVANSGTNTASGVGDGELAATLPTIESFVAERKERAASLEKYNLLNELVTSEEYGIVDDPLGVDVTTLLDSEEWEYIELGSNGLRFQYPQEGWYLQTDMQGGVFQVVLTTTASGEAGTSSFAKITIGEYERTFDQTLFDWIESPSFVEGYEEPPKDTTLQYVTIGGNTFLGSIFFDEHVYTGVKSAYAEVSATNVFAASLEVEGVEKGSKRAGEYDQVFYTILESLEVK